MSFNAYLNDVKNSLLKSMCVQHFSSQTVERHSKPEIEIKYKQKHNINYNFII